MCGGGNHGVMPTPGPYASTLVLLLCGPMCAGCTDNTSADDDGNSTSSSADPTGATTWPGGDTTADDGETTVGSDDDASGTTGNADDDDDVATSTGTVGDSTAAETSGTASDDGQASTGDTLGESTSTSGSIDESCIDEDIGSSVGDDVAEMTFEGEDDITLTCHGFNAPDYVVRFTAAERGLYTFGLPEDQEDEIAVGVLADGCGGLQLGCSNADFGSVEGGWLPGATVQRVLEPEQSVLVVTQSTTAGDPLNLHVDVTPIGNDDGCVDVDIGGEIGIGVAEGMVMGGGGLSACQSETPVVLRFVAPETGTYVFTDTANAGSLHVFSPGCDESAPLDTCRTNTMVGGLEQPPEPRSAIDLVGGQEVAIRIGTSVAEAAYSLDIELNSTPGGTCCTGRHNFGQSCSEPDIVACVCEADDFCCDTNWDFWCLSRARLTCDASCIGE